MKERQNDNCKDCRVCDDQAHSTISVFEVHHMVIDGILAEIGLEIAGTIPKLVSVGIPRTEVHIGVNLESTSKLYRSSRRQSNFICLSEDQNPSFTIWPT